MKTEGPWELGDLLEGQNLVRDLIARGGPFTRCSTRY
jgi:hypothetical protein